MSNKRAKRKFILKYLVNKELEYKSINKHVLPFLKFFDIIQYRFSFHKRFLRLAIFVAIFGEILSVEVTDTSSHLHRFIPQYWKSKDLRDLPVAKQQELDELNSDVLAKLADKNLFSQGETAEGRVCVKIGLVRVYHEIYPTCYL